MKARLYMDKGAPFVTCWPETLTDGSTAWNIEFRGSDVVLHCLDEKRADVAFTAIATAIKVVG